ncbi:hypothetical protein BGZ94_009947 [Podila epigama]|nr:hypothetical protein BGZ94_009947 [Podila epigama]
MAKVAEQSERYTEMVAFMKDITKLRVQLTLEERNLLSVAFKNLAGARRAEWRIVSSIEGKEAEQGNKDRVERLQAYRTNIETELKATCTDILTILDQDIIPFIDSASEDKDECNVFYYKMKADYFRYLAEFSSGDVKAKATTDADEAYTLATGFAKNLPPTHPIGLGLALNYSVFKYEIIGDRKDALQTAKAAFDIAIKEFESSSDDTSYSYKDSGLILQLLRDNLLLWNTDQDELDE